MQLFIVYMKILRPVLPGKSDDISSVGYYSTATNTGLHSGNELVLLEIFFSREWCMMSSYRMHFGSLALWDGISQVIDRFSL